MNEGLVIGELVIASSTSTAVAMSINVEPLITALITFGISVITVVGGELIKYLVAYLKKKRENLELNEDEIKMDDEEKKKDE